jgi:hypothetical protein
MDLWVAITCLAKREAIKKSRCSGTEIGTPKDAARFSLEAWVPDAGLGRELILGRKRSRTSPSSARIWAITLCQRLRQLEGRVSSRLASRTLCAGEVAGRLWRSLTPAAPPRVWDLSGRDEGTAVAAEPRNMVWLR